MSTALCSPLDVAKTRAQVQSTAAGAEYQGVFSALAAIYRHEGVAGWYHGFTPAVCSVGVFWTVYFPCYDMASGLSGDFVADGEVNLFDLSLQLRMIHGSMDMSSQFMLSSATADWAPRPLVVRPFPSKPACWSSVPVANNPPSPTKAYRISRITVVGW